MTQNNPNMNLEGATISANGGAGVGGGDGGSITIISNSSGQVAMGENISQSQSINQNEFKELIDNLLTFQKGIDKLELSFDDKNIVNGDISTAIKEAKKTKPSLSIINKYYSVSKFILGVSLQIEYNISIKGKVLTAESHWPLGLHPYPGLHPSYSHPFLPSYPIHFCMLLQVWIQAAG